MGEERIKQIAEQKRSEDNLSDSQPKNDVSLVMHGKLEKYFDDNYETIFKPIGVNTCKEWMDKARLIEKMAKNLPVDIYAATLGLMDNGNLTLHDEEQESGITTDELIKSAECYLLKRSYSTSKAPNIEEPTIWDKFINRCLPKANLVTKRMDVSKIDMDNAVEELSDLHEHNYEKEGFETNLKEGL